MKLTISTIKDGIGLALGAGMVAWTALVGTPHSDTNATAGVSTNPDSASVPVLRILKTQSASTGESGSGTLGINPPPNPDDPNHPEATATPTDTPTP